MQLSRGFGIDPATLYGVLVLLAFPLVHAALVRTGFRGDGLLLPVTMVLCGLGLVEISRLQPGWAVRQTAWIALGLGVCVLVYWLARSPESLGRYRYLYATAAVALLVSTLLFGVERGGARQWVELGGVSFQPSEAVKVVLVLFLASYLAEHQILLARRLPPEVELRVLLPVGAVVGLSLLLFTVQRDLGGALLYLSVVLGMIYVGTGRTEYVAMGVTAFALGAGVCTVVFPHVRVRMEIWLDPWRDPAGSGYQILQALFALGSGGLLGTGPGLGHPELVPAAHTDLILAAIGEELGYAGALGILLLYMVLVARGFRIALRAAHPFAQLVAAGASAVLAFSSLLIVGGSIRFVPLTGIPLPFVSYGGSSAVSNFVLLGLLLGISHHTEAAVEGKR